MNNDKRTAHVRRSVRIPIYCWEEGNVKRLGESIEVVSRDISIDGISFYSHHLYPMDTIFLIDFYLPGEKQAISCKIKVNRIDPVVNRDDYVIGAQYVNLPVVDKVKVATAIEQLDLYKLLNSAIAGLASDLHLTVGKPPMVRRDGKILPMAADVIQPGQVEAMVYPLLKSEQIKFFEERKELDFAFSPSLDSRFRVNLHWQKGFVEAAFRNIPTKTKAFKDLNLPVEQMEKFCKEKGGLILIAGTTGSGKTTTMSSMVQYMNAKYRRIIITVEDPIEYTFKSENCIVKQRELGSDTVSYAEALKRVLRQDPDIICVGELLDGECLAAAMRAAETGHLVISTIHAPSSIAAIERAINFFPPEYAGNIAQQLSSSLIGILFQLLLPKLSGGRILSTELMISNNAMKNMIRERKYSQMESILQTGRSLGMYTLKNNMKVLLDGGLISQDVFEEYSKGDYP